MKVLLVSPIGFAITPQTRYAGIETLVWNYASELTKNHQVSVFGHSDNIFPEGVTLYGYKPEENEDIYQQSELKCYSMYSSLIREFDVIHDFSHQHLIARYNPSMPTLNIFWHWPVVAQYPKAPYNIIAPSKWAAREFTRVYRHQARYQPTIALDLNTYKVNPNRHRNDRFLSLGMLTPRKGHLEALHICKKAGVPLDIVGKGNNDEYQEQVEKLCDGRNYRYLGEVTEEEKVKLYQTNKALIFVNQEPEVTSHKVQEAMLCGQPVIVSNIGALPEIITHNVNGFLCNNEGQFLQAIKEVDRLESMKVYEFFKSQYSIEDVIAQVIPLYEQVSKGLRW